MGRKKRKSKIRMDGWLLERKENHIVVVMVVSSDDEHQISKLSDGDYFTYFLADMFDLSIASGIKSKKVRNVHKVSPIESVRVFKCNFSSLTPYFEPARARMNNVRICVKFTCSKL